MAKAKKTPPPYWVELSGDLMKIHLSGELLASKAFLEIIELMKKNREAARPKPVRFVVSNGVMMMAVKYAIPSQFYEEVVLEGQNQVSENGVLKDAAGL